MQLDKHWKVTIHKKKNLKKHLKTIVISVYKAKLDSLAYPSVVFDVS